MSPLLGLCAFCGGWFVTSGMVTLLLAALVFGGYFGIRYYVSYQRGEPTKFKIREMEVSEEWSDDLPKDVYTVYTNKGPVRVKKSVFEKLQIGMTYQVHASRWPEDEWHTFGAWTPLTPTDSSP